MLSIDCPVCGARPESEFFCIGEGDARIPALNESEAELAAYLYLRTNAAGVQTERWVHRHGCGEWLRISRDTRRNVIVSVAFLNDGGVSQDTI